MCPLLLQFFTIEISLWIITCTCCSYFYFQLILLLQDASKYSPLWILWVYCLAALFRINTPTDNSSHLPSIAHPQLFMCFTKVFKILFDLSKILSSLLLLEYFLACIMVNPISIVILLAALVTMILSPLIQYAANACNPQSVPRIYPFGSGIILRMSWISTNQIAIDCTPKATQLIHP